jgi:hypothetical protein
MEPVALSRSIEKAAIAGSLRFKLGDPQKGLF